MTEPNETGNTTSQPDAATGLWSAFMGNRPVLLVRNVETARRVLLCALALTAQDTVLLPANVTHALLEAVKDSGACVCFGDLDYALNLCSERAVRVAWAEPMLGLPTGVHALAAVTVIDHGDSLPHGAAKPFPLPGRAAVAIYGLQLAAESDQAGAVLVFHDHALAARVAALLGPADRLADGLALAQLAQLQAVGAATACSAGDSAHRPPGSGRPAAAATREHRGAGPRGRRADSGREQRDNVCRLSARRADTVCLAGGTATAPLRRGSVPGHGGTPGALAAGAGARGADMLTWRQTVLGIVKSAEYLGVRWRTDPARAVQYAALLTQMYGPNHDAYRPVFDVGTKSSTDAELVVADLQAPACRLDKFVPATHNVAPVAGLFHVGAM